MRHIDLLIRLDRGQAESFYLFKKEFLPLAEHAERVRSPHPDLRAGLRSLPHPFCTARRWVPAGLERDS
jgi:hypothetical protein